MKRSIQSVFLFLCLILLCSCSGGKKEEPKVETIAVRSWAASDSSVHSVTLLPMTARKPSAEEGLTIQHKSVDGITLIEIYREDARIAPIMFFLHEHGGNKEQFMEEAVVYAQAGFYCVLFDLYGYGERAVHEVTESIEAAVKATADIDLLLEYYRLSPNADADRFVLYGQSMGGSAVWYYEAEGKKTPLAVVVCSAASDFSLLSDMGTVRNGIVQGPYWEENRFTEYCKIHNPIAQISRIAQIPALVYQGMRDDAIPPEETREFEKKLLDIGADNITFVYDRDGGHDVTSAFRNRILPFLKQYVRLN